MTFSGLTGFLLVVAGGGGGALGWHVRRLLTSGKEADLKKSLYESKGAIPQLEASVRTREQRIGVLQTEMEALRARIGSFESAVTQKDAEIVKRDREIRRLSSELAIAQEGGQSGDSDALHPQVQMVEGGEALSTAAAPPVDDLERLKKIETRFEALKKVLITRDDKIAALEEKLAKTDAFALEAELETLRESDRAHSDELAARDEKIKALEARVQQETDQRAQFETLAKRRTETNREVKDKLVKLESQLPKVMETMKAKNAVIAERDATIRELSADLTATRNEREARDRTIVTLTRDVAQQEALVAQRDGEIRALKEGARAYEERLALQKREIELTQRTLQRTEATVREREAALAKHVVETEAVRAQQAEHDHALESLRSAIRDRDFRIDTLTTDLAKANAALEATREAQAHASAPPTSTEATDKLAAELKVARDKVESLTRQNDMLERGLAAAERKHQDVDRERAQLAQRASSNAAPEAVQMRVLESQLASARERCQRVEDELLAVSREAKTLRARVKALEEGEVSDGGNSVESPPVDEATPSDLDVPVLHDLAGQMHEGANARV